MPLRVLDRAASLFSRYLPPGSLSPLGPIFGKELRSTARRKRTYVLRFAYLGVLLLVLLAVYAANYGSNDYGGMARKAQRMAEMGTYFFGAFSFFTLVAMALLGPVLTSTAINAERLHKTLPVLLMTPITAWQIVAGKLFSRLLVAFTLIGLSLPVLALVRLLGGVEIEQMMVSLLLCLTVAITSAVIGLFFSNLMARAYAVILIAYMFMGVVWGLIPLLSAMIIFGILDLQNALGQQWMMGIVSWLNPYPAMFGLCVPQGRMMAMAFPWERVVITHLGLSVVLAIYTAIILRRRARREAEGSGGGAAAPVAPPAPSFEIVGEPAASSDGNVVVHEKPRKRIRTSPPVSYNPVLWREKRRPLLARLWQKWAATMFFLLSLIVIYAGMASEGELDEAWVQAPFAVIFCAILNLLAVVLAASAIGQEKETDTWTLLLVTPVSGAQIVLGKLAGLVRRFTWPMALVLAHFTLFAIAGVINFTTYFILLYLTVTTNVIWLATGLYFSLRLRTVTFAVTANFLLVLFLYGGVPLVLLIVGGFAADEPEVAEWGCIYMPYAYMVSAVEYLNPGYRYNQGNPYYRDVWVPAFDRISSQDFVTLVLYVGVAHLIATALVLWYTIANFDRIVGRAEQTDRVSPLDDLPHHARVAL